MRRMTIDTVIPKPPHADPIGMQVGCWGTVVGARARGVDV